MEHLRGVYILPSIHFAICLLSMLAYVLPPKLQFLGILWVVLNVVDFPVSGVAVMLAWPNGFFAGAWIVVVGTLWWYLLSMAAVLLRRKLRP